ncbi:hypothetical protein [Rhodococcoides yunnanense]|uniref:Uncharacterized protein n=1 Tax=Rhodococcoides yunnanense TaxID=278209 RepID=A0ABU4BCM2_9NOCA|nr:hypothetical protein [Rhodococcus yunnanensis]MDV6261948.1 hypothetical protein [Rhodococcus yunnanensis]
MFAVAIFGFLGSSQAAAEPTDSADQVETTGTEVLTKYSSGDIIKLLLAGQGPAADANPGLIRYLGFDPEKPITEPEALDALVSEYLAFDPSFDSTVRPDLSSGDPLKAESGLVTFTESFQAFLAEKGQQVPDAPQSRGCGAGAQVCFTAYAVVLANAALYANVAVATLAVATLAFGFFYLMDGTAADATEIERTTFIANLTSAME